MLRDKIIEFSQGKKYLTEKQLKEYLTVLNHDWAEAKQILAELEKQEIIRYSHTRFSFSLVAKEPGLTSVIETLEPELITAKKQKMSGRKLVFMVFSLITSLACAVVSVLYSYAWLVQILNVWIAALLSVALVGSGIMFFEGIFILWNRFKPFSFAFAFLWLVTTLFSMSATLAGQFDSFEENRNLTLNPKLIEYRQLEKANALLLNDIQNLESEIRTLSQTVRDSGDTNLFRVIDVRRRELSRTQVKWNQNNKQINEMLVEGLEIDTRKNFFELAAQIAKLDEFIFYAIMAFYPALFIDLVAPIGFTLFMFLKLEE